MDREQRRLVDKLAEELEAGNLAIFAGAGFSMAAGYVDWKNLLRPIAIDLDLDVERETDLVALAQYHANANVSNRHRLNQLLVTEFSQSLTPTENHRILARLPINTWWTTNYDRLIEQSLREAGRVVDAKYRTPQLTTTVPKRDVVLYKMHGDVENPDDAILTRDDYERYHIRMRPFIDALKGDLVSKTFLFVGFSFADPNLDYILSRVRITYEQNQRQSHCILRHVTQNIGEVLADFEYRQRKQQLFDKELLRFGIKVTYVDEYADVTEILRAIETRHRRRSIFISGAAQRYDPFGEKESERFVFGLAKILSEKNFRILSGFGLGIGSSVIAGVIEATAMGRRPLDDDRLVVRPFPQSAPGSHDLAELWRRYRDDILKHSGIAIFVFGNKLDGARVVHSEGMRMEYELAIENNVFPIPVGVTGYVSSELWADTVARFKDGRLVASAEVQTLVLELGDATTSLERVQQIVLTLIDIL